MDHNSTRHHQSTPRQHKFIFDLEALKNRNKNEINRVGKNFEKINQRQRDLIRHNVSQDVWKEIFQTFRLLSELTEKVHARSADSFDSFSSRHTGFHQSVNQSEMPREEKRDSREAVDRQHEREARVQQENHKESMNATKYVATTVAVAAVAVSIGAAVFAGLKRE